VADAGRGERGGKVAVDLIAKPDQDPGRESRLRLGEHLRERIGGRPADIFESTTEVGRRRLDGQ
jgi:hypothetical protein